jgi:hypothetical protein
MKFTYDVTNIDNWQHSGELKDGEIVIDPTNKKYYYKGFPSPDRAINEVVFSKLGNALGMNTAKNHFATNNSSPWTHNGIISEWFLAAPPHEQKVRELQHFFSLPQPRLQSLNVTATLEHCRKNMPLAPDFEKHFVETYLQSVLFANVDHADRNGLRNVGIMKNGNGEYDFAPYHDLEFSAHAGAAQHNSTHIAREIRNGYLLNETTLRRTHKSTFDEFADRLKCVGLDDLCDFNTPEIVDFIGDKRRTQNYSLTLKHALRAQSKFMLNH